MNDTIFMFGMTQRVGTNYLMRMINEHPDLINCPPIYEDYLLASSQHLVNYVMEVESNWGKPWKNEGPFKEELLESLGEGLYSFLRHRSGSATSRLITKTPSISGLRYFQLLFPGAKCIILIRDGRDVTASMMKGFGRNFEKSLRMWVNGAKSLIRLRNNIPEFSRNHLIIRYEVLIENTDKTLRQIFDYFFLDQSTYNFDKVTDTPVIGSSFFKGGEEKLHWEAIPVTEKFKSIKRWEDWNKEQKEQFAEIAGETMEQLGYSCNF